MNYERNKLTIHFFIIILCFIVQTTETFILENYSTNNTYRIRRQTVCDGFRCSSDQCIDADKECDGVANCKDSSDETEACNRIKCQSFLFRCKYGACINPEYECDGKKDCVDRSDETSSKCKSPLGSSKCSSTEFQCDSGQCIDQDNKCDGIAHCSDGSDETPVVCKGIKCPGYTYQCAYGACVNSNSRCNGVNDCVDSSDEADCREINAIPTTIQPTTNNKLNQTKGNCELPQHPKYGKWTVKGSSNPYAPRDFVVSTTILEIQCGKKYVLKGAQYLVCLDGKWTQDLPHCLLACPPVESSNVTFVSCILNNYPQDCKYPVSGTIATYSCAPFYEDLNLSRNPNRYCIDGSWDNSKPKCMPACGKKSVSVTPLIVGGNKSNKGDYPWQIALYENKSNKFLCGGALINPRVILSAAHCVTTGSTAQKKPKENYIVAVGKYYSKFDDERDKDASQYSTLKEIFIPDEYRGDPLKYSHDIAVLVTEKIFELNKYVSPVCVDWGTSNEHFLLQPNTEGIVTGWGYTSIVNPQTSEVLKEITVPYVDYPQCLQDLPPDYTDYLTADKICSGYLNQSKGVCSGDSGGSLVFRNTNDGRYYTTGIVSISPIDNGHCNIQQYALYTKVSRHINFIQKIERMYKI